MGERTPNFNYMNSSKWAMSFWDTWNRAHSVGFWVRTWIPALLLPSFRVLGKLRKLARPQFVHLKYGETASAAEVVATPKWDQPDGFQHPHPSPHQTAVSLLGAQETAIQHTPDNQLCTTTCAIKSSPPTCWETTTLPGTRPSSSHQPSKQTLLPSQRRKPRPCGHWAQSGLASPSRCRSRCPVPALARCMTRAPATCPGTNPHLPPLFQQENGTWALTDFTHACLEQSRHINRGLGLNQETLPVALFSLLKFCADPARLLS